MDDAISRRDERTVILGGFASPPKTSGIDNDGGGGEAGFQSWNDGDGEPLSNRVYLLSKPVRGLWALSGRWFWLTDWGTVGRCNSLYLSKKKVCPYLRLIPKPSARQRLWENLWRGGWPDGGNRR